MTHISDSSPLDPANSRETASASESGCDEYVDVSRRRLLEAAARGFTGARRGAPAAGAAGAALAVPRVAFAGGGGGPSRDVIVYVMLRGGMDGLTLCAPYADPDYATQRGALAIPPPGSLDGAIDLDGFFGLAPSAAPLLAPYQAGDLVLIHTAGSTDPTRSHFEAMTRIEKGVPNQGTTALSSGWLGRHLAGTPASNATATMRAVALDFVAPLTLAGGPKTLNIPELGDFELAGHASTQAARKNVLRTMYAGEEPLIAGSAVAALDTIDVLGAIDFANYSPSGGGVYPSTDFGDRFKSAAALIKADVGVEAIEIDRGGWDHHDNMGPINGQLADMLAELSETLTAFWRDLGSLMGSVTVVAMSEFGRRVDANGSGGADHGRGGAMMVLGGNVNGGQVVRDWVGLDPSVLDNLALPVRIDYRDILIEILRERAGNPAASALFPNHVPTDWNLVV